MRSQRTLKVRKTSRKNSQVLIEPQHSQNLSDQQRDTPRPGGRARAHIMPALPAAAALSFLKDTRGALSWTVGDLAATLKIPMKDATQVLTMLQFQGYIRASSAEGEWLTTSSGVTVSGSKLPHFTRESIESALASLSVRIQGANKDAKSPYKVIKAVAFGDFLSDRQRVQAADVGIALQSRVPGEAREDSAMERSAQRAFLRRLRGKTQLLNIQPYENWMSARWHRSLL